jgi:hypothetical protein
MATTLADFRSSDTCSRGLQGFRGNAPTSWTGRPGHGTAASSLAGPTFPSNRRARMWGLAGVSSGTVPLHGSNRACNWFRVRFDSSAQSVGGRECVASGNGNRISIRQDNGAYASGPSIQPLYREKDWFRPRRRARRLSSSAGETANPDPPIESHSGRVCKGWPRTAHTRTGARQRVHPQPLRRPRLPRRVVWLPRRRRRAAATIISASPF